MFDILLFPFRAIGGLIGFFFGMMGRVISAVVGLSLCALGVILTATVVGAFAGIPLVLFGFLLIIRAIF